jgi:hypothetical protein
MLLSEPALVNETLNFVAEVYHASTLRLAEQPSKSTSGLVVYFSSWSDSPLRCELVGSAVISDAIPSAVQAPCVNGSIRLPHEEDPGRPSRSPDEIMPVTF